VLTRIEIALALAASGEVVVRDLIGVVVWLRVVLAGPDTVDFLDGLEVGSVGFQLDYSAWGHAFRVSLTGPDTGGRGLQQFLGRFVMHPPEIVRVEQFGERNSLRMPMKQQ